MWYLLKFIGSTIEDNVLKNHWVIKIFAPTCKKYAHAPKANLRQVAQIRNIQSIMEKLFTHLVEKKPLTVQVALMNIFYWSGGFYKSRCKNNSIEWGVILLSSSSKMVPDFFTPGLPVQPSSTKIIIKRLTIINIVFECRLHRVVWQLQLTQAFGHGLCAASSKMHSVLLHSSELLMFQFPLCHYLLFAADG